MSFWHRTKQFLLGLSTLALAACSNPRPADPAVADWMTNPQDAVAAAMQKGRPLFVVFLGSDWSSASQDTIKDALDTRAFKEFADSHLILLKVDFSRKGLTAEMEKAYADLAKQMNVDHFPEFMLADPPHRVAKFAVIPSYNFGPGGSADFVAQISGILDAWHDMVANQLAQQAQAQGQAPAPAPALPQTGTTNGVSTLPSPAELFRHDTAPSIATPPPTAPASLPTMPGAVNSLPSNSAPVPTPAPTNNTSLPAFQLK